MTTSSEERPNYETFRECLSDRVLSKLASTPPSHERKQRTRRQRQRTKDTRHVSDRPSTSLVERSQSERPNPEEAESAQEDWGDFIDYLASEIFPTLPRDLRLLSYAAVQGDASLSPKYTEPLPDALLESITAVLPPSVADTLTAYALLPSDSSPSSDDLAAFLRPALTAYVAATTSAPPVWSQTRAEADGCEICGRDWVGLTYHHLIPREQHERVRRRGWHPEWMLNSVAWLCGACHRMVHRVATNEELAKEWYTVERLKTREDVQSWAEWVGRVRWKAK